MKLAQVLKGRWETVACHPGAWDGQGVCAGRVYHWGSRFCMFYAGSDGQVARSGLAFSTNLFRWTRFAGNPVLGGPETYPADGVFYPAPHLVQHEGEFYLLYTHNLSAPDPVAHLDLARLTR